jgi:1,4-alpha-glucan branching enzyme
VLLNFTPVTWENYRVGVPSPGEWQVVATSDDRLYGGTGEGVAGLVDTSPGEQQSFEQSLSLTLAPLSAVFMVPAEFREDS